MADICDCLGQESGDPDDREKSQIIQEAMDKVNDEIDSFTKSMISDERSNQLNQIDQGFDPRNVITFPPPYNDTSTIGLNCFDGGNVPASLASIYSIPAVDEYYGDLGFFSDLCYYGKYSDGVLGHSFDENAEPPSKADWSDSKDDLAEARNYFQGAIGGQIYGVSNINALQKDERNNPPADALRKKQLNDWEEVDVNNLGDKNQILSALLGDTFDGDTSDMWVTLIAFCGYGSHRTGPLAKSQQHPDTYFVNDVTFLAQYGVRSGFEMYGAAAYFDSKYHLQQIFLSDSGLTYKPPNEAADGTGSTIQEWNHAKWAWKVSVSVATFLVDMLAHSRFRESSGLIAAVRKYLSADHAIRRFLVPFTLGTVYCNRVFNEYLRENGLYHRCFAFKYGELQRLIKDGMSDAPVLNKGELRDISDQMKYRFRLFRKKVVIMKKLPDEIYPIYTDVWDFWVQTLKFVEEYIQQFYNDEDTDDSLLAADKELVAFYEAVLQNLGIANKYRLKKFNIINILTHFLCNATIWSHHINTAVSFEYSIDADFTGLKIVGNYAKQSNVSGYAEYCLVVLSKGWQYANLRLPPQIARPADPNDKRAGWGVVLLDEKLNETSKLFRNYFENSLDTVKKNIAGRNKQRIAPYHGCDPQYLQSSIKL